MIWQDIVISIGGWVMIAAIVPSLIGKDKPALSTSLVTGTILLSFAVCYGTLNLWSSALSTGVLAAAWLVLAVQQWIRQKGEQNR
jgi:hypothetical protein